MEDDGAEAAAPNLLVRRTGCDTEIESFKLGTCTLEGHEVKDFQFALYGFGATKCEAGTPQKGVKVLSIAELHREQRLAAERKKQRDANFRTGIFFLGLSGGAHGEGATGSEEVFDSAPANPNPIQACPGKLGSIRCAELDSSDRGN